MDVDENRHKRFLGREGAYISLRGSGIVLWFTTLALNFGVIQLMTVKCCDSLPRSWIQLWFGRSFCCDSLPDPWNLLWLSNWTRNYAVIIWLYKQFYIHCIYYPRHEQFWVIHWIGQLFVFYTNRINSAVIHNLDYMILCFQFLNHELRCASLLVTWTQPWFTVLDICNLLSF